MTNEDPKPTLDLSRYRVPILDRALAVVELLGQHREALNVTEMCFKRFTPNTITSREGLEAELCKVGERGYAFDLSEEMEGQYCIGAPIFDGRNSPVASLWITAPATRLPDSELDGVGRLVRSHSELISTGLGSIHPPVIA